VFEFKLPDLGEGIAEGEILKWHVKEGHDVAEDAPLVDVETDKAAVTIPSPRGGKVARLGGAVGDTVAVGHVIAVIDDGAAVVTPARAAKTAREAAGAPALAPTPTGPRRPVPAAPATRRLAREMGVDIDVVPPSGPGGRVTPEDVHRFAAAGGTVEHVRAHDVHDDHSFAEFAAHAAATIPFLEVEPLPDFAAEGPVEIVPLRSVRRKVARKMVTSMTLVPHVAHMDEADVSELEIFRRRQRERHPDDPGLGSLTLLAFVMKAITAGLRAAPSFNASLDPFKEEIVYKKYYNLGFATDTPRGLMVPVVRDTDRKSLRDIAAEVAAKAQLAREGKLPAEAMRGGTFTITNVGPLGGTALLATINYPEVAILAMGRAQKKAVVRDGEIVVRTMLPLTLAFDHRIADGADAARFVSELIRHLSDPSLLLMQT
jgi:pyruvate dehydrogenase E2 component (dihydrolipoamide acetyltransferase)